MTSGKKTITSGGMQRTYIIDIPTNYDMNKPYRFFYTSHWISSTAEAVQQQNFYFLKPLATAANEPAIFLAPQALPGNPNGTWDTSKNTDHILFDDLLAYVKENLCIDTTRVFATGFSFGGMMTYSLSVNHQKDIRAAVGIAPANYNIYVPTKTHQPIAWMQTTGMSDTTCPMGQWEQHDPGREVHRHRARYRQRVHGPVDHPDVDVRRASLRRLHGVHDGSAHQGLHLQRPPHQHQQRSGLHRKLDSPGVLEVLHAVLSRDMPVVIT